MKELHWESKKHKKDLKKSVFIRSAAHKISQGLWILQKGFITTLLFSTALISVSAVDFLRLKEGRLTTH